MKDELEYDRQTSLGRGGGDEEGRTGMVCWDRHGRAELTWELQGSSNLAGLGRTPFGGVGMRHVKITRHIVDYLIYMAKESLVFCH